MHANYQNVFTVDYSQYNQAIKDISSIDHSEFFPLHTAEPTVVYPINYEIDPLYILLGLLELDSTQANFNLNNEVVVQETINIEQ